MKRILFVNPSCSGTVFGNMRMLALPPMGLGMLASRTPDTFEVAIVDECIEPIDFCAKADLVAVGATTVQAPRAYEIIREFKRRGVPSVMGGIHASVLPGEASRYADTVVVGEADEIWNEVVDDFDHGRLRPEYRVERRPDITHSPPINRALFSNKYFVHSIQTSRGCPCNCSFCSVTQFNGRKYRFRAIDEVVAEMGGLRQRRFFVADDSIVGLGADGIEHARNLFAAMKGLGASWGSQVCITIAEHDDLLRAAREAGGDTFYIGFESVETAALKSMNKGVNLRPAVRDYKEAIKRIHDHGIGVIGGFILGTDADTPDIFDRTIDFIDDAGIDGSQFTILTPFPGTRLYEQMKREGRLLHARYPEDWLHYNAYDAVIRPRNMTVEQLIEGRRRVYEATSTLGKSLARAVKTLASTRSLNNVVTNFFWNYSNYRAMRRAPASASVPGPGPLARGLAALAVPPTFHLRSSSSEASVPPRSRTGHPVTHRSP